MKFSSDTLQGHPNPSRARLPCHAIGLRRPKTQSHWSAWLPLRQKPISSLLAGASDGLAPLCSYLHGCDSGADWPAPGPPRPLPRAPRLRDAAARGPAPRDRAAGPRGRGGAGVLRAEGAGRGPAAADSGQGAGTWSTRARGGAGVQPAGGGLLGSGLAVWNTLGWCLRGWERL